MKAGDDAGDVERAGAWGSDLAADILEEMLIALLEHLV